MATHERDELSGQLTTGHDWDGIKELRTPIPTWWLVTFVVTWVFSVGYLILYPSFATTFDYARGTLGWSSRGDLATEMTAAKQAQASYRQLLVDTPLNQIEANAELRRFAVVGGQAVFNENCAACHGVGGGGTIGEFPALVDDDWLWGGKIEDILKTVRHGVRSPDPETRDSTMPAFGELLSAAEIGAVADYVLTLPQKNADATRAAMPGAKLYADNCASCHGKDGQGDRTFGAPRLNDAIWLYGSSKQDLVRQITQPRMGDMPAWGPRFDEATLRMLAVYVHTLGGGER